MTPVEATVYRGGNDGKVMEGKELFTPGEEELLLKVQSMKEHVANKQVTHSGLCGTDLYYFEGGQVLGHEGVGTLVDMGKNVPQGLFSIGETLGFGLQLNVCIRNSISPLVI
jgi:D-arabinose 1-dehydrogenase-like Zn-dependent alcohol dehydrogenase